MVAICKRSLPGFCLICMAALITGHAQADQFNLALLRITENADTTVLVSWKRPAMSQEASVLRLALPNTLEPLAPASRYQAGSNLVETRLYRSHRSMRTQVIDIVGLQGLSFDVMLSVKLANGDEISTVLNGSNSRFEIPDKPESLALAVSYARTGLLHISEGVDHLLFLLALVLLIGSLGQLIAAVTAFTVAHSITLALATFDIITLPAQPVEALIALSIVFLATELVHAHKEEAPKARLGAWKMAGFFALLHGLGFAGALADIGLPTSEIPLALLMFNLGVEVGQLIFVFFVFALLSILAHLHKRASQYLSLATTYAIGSVAAFWTIQRVVDFV